ncbi:hypothetical protein [Undibacterium sp. TJN19]|uniref:hypothetical protein n=1 Tax=Undibacterium sp. TJN19 TaxID=3413055 RepID=UPI003BF24793
MFNWAMMATGLCLAGFVYGWRRRPGVAGERSYLAWIMAIVFGAPILSLLLANVFGSDTLGWIFGLSLMFVWPLAFLFIAGRLAGALLNTQAVQTSHHATNQQPLQVPMLHIRIDRDSVHAGDDTISHAENIAVPVDMSLASLLEQIRKRHFLPSISGGKATWMIESSGHQVKTIGVLAQQWQDPCLMIDSSIDVGRHFSGQQPNLFFRYRCQIDPEAVRTQLHASYTTGVTETQMNKPGGIAGLARYATYLRAL